MPTKTETQDVRPTDRIVVWALMAGLAIALLRYAEAAALPAHFV